MVDAVRGGQSLRSVAHQFNVSPSTVQLWVHRAHGRPLDQVNWEDASHAPVQQASQTSQVTETRILTLRNELAKSSDLGEYGAQAIRKSLVTMGDSEEISAPSVATINRILKRHGLFDVRRRVRRPPPPPGWYLPEVAARRAEIDETDFVEDLSIEGGPVVCILNTISLHGGWCASWPTEAMRATFARKCLLSHWREFGLPDYAQFDNGSVFYGTHSYPDNVGSITRLCLSLNVTPVFAVPREFGIQSSIESYNNRWQQKVWQRVHMTSFAELCGYSSRYVAAVRQKHRQRFEGSPARRVFPADWSEPDDLVRSGCVIFLRRTNEDGGVQLLGNNFPISINWPNRLVRCEVDLAAEKIRVYGLRRQEPQQQMLLREWNYLLPDKAAHRWQHSRRPTEVDRTEQ